MVMTRSTAVGSIVTGSIMLGFAIIAIICGAISAGKLSGEAAASAGLWSLFFVVPGILSIVAGATKNGIVMGFALFFNIVAVLISTAASIVLIIITVAMKEFIGDYWKYCTDDGNECSCIYSRSPGETDAVSWDMKCSDLNTVYSLFVAALVAYIILALTTFTASIFGCLGTCCAPVDPIMVVTPGVPVNTGGTIVVSSNQSSMMHSGYPGGMAPAYGHGQPPAYGQMQPPAYGDKSGLVQNMAY